MEISAFIEQSKTNPSVVEELKSHPDVAFQYFLEICSLENQGDKETMFFSLKDLLLHLTTFFDDDQIQLIIDYITTEMDDLCSDNKINKILSDTLIAAVANGKFTVSSYREFTQNQTHPQFQVRLLNSYLEYYVKTPRFTMEIGFKAAMLALNIALTGSEIEKCAKEEAIDTALLLPDNGEIAENIIVLVLENDIDSFCYMWDAFSTKVTNPNSIFGKALETLDFELDSAQKQSVLMFICDVITDITEITVEEFQKVYEKIIEVVEESGLNFDISTFFTAFFRTYENDYFDSSDTFEQHSLTHLYFMNCIFENGCGSSYKMLPTDAMETISSNFADFFDDSCIEIVRDLIRNLVPFFYLIENEKIVALADQIMENKELDGVVCDILVDLTNCGDEDLKRKIYTLINEKTDDTNDQFYTGMMIACIKNFRLTDDDFEWIISFMSNFNPIYAFEIESVVISKMPALFKNELADQFDDVCQALVGNMSTSELGVFDNVFSTLFDKLGGGEFLEFFDPYEEIEALVAQLPPEKQKTAVSRYLLRRNSLVTGEIPELIYNPIDRVLFYQQEGMLKSFQGDYSTSDFQSEVLIQCLIDVFYKAKDSEFEEMVRHEMLEFIQLIIVSTPHELTAVFIKCLKLFGIAYREQILGEEEVQAITTQLTEAIQDEDNANEFMFMEIAANYGFHFSELYEKSSLLAMRAIIEDPELPLVQEVLDEAMANTNNPLYAVYYLVAIARSPDVELPVNRVKEILDNVWIPKNCATLIFDALMLVRNTFQEEIEMQVLIASAITKCEIYGESISNFGIDYSMIHHYFLGIVQHLPRISSYLPDQVKLLDCMIKVYNPEYVIAGEGEN